MLSVFNLYLLIIPQTCLQMNRKVRSAIMVICGLASPLLIPKKKSRAAMPRNESQERSLENGHFGK